MMSSTAQHSQQSRDRETEEKNVAGASSYNADQNGFNLPGHDRRNQNQTTSVAVASSTINNNNNNNADGGAIGAIGGGGSGGNNNVAATSGSETKQQQQQNIRDRLLYQNLSPEYLHPMCQYIPTMYPPPPFSMIPTSSLTFPQIMYCQQQQHPVHSYDPSNNFLIMPNNPGGSVNGSGGYQVTNKQNFMNQQQYFIAIRNNNTKIDDQASNKPEISASKPIPLSPNIPDEIIPSSTLQSSNSMTENTMATGNGQYKSDDYDIPDFPTMTFDQSNKDQLAELTKMALRGCEIAEKLANFHKTRPCFKKIDSLCARMKQDLVRPDGVLANINSQGVAWAVKDFIFVFTRIINAWIIIKGYVYNTPEGLNKVKSSLNPNFNVNFLKWQDATVDFVDSLIRSFLSLDHLVQNQRASFQKADVKVTNAKDAQAERVLIDDDDEVKLLSAAENLKADIKRLDENLKYFLSPTLPMPSSEPPSEGMNKMKLTESSESTQRDAVERGAYIKTGVYNPIQKFGPMFVTSTPFKKPDFNKYGGGETGVQPSTAGAAAIGEGDGFNHQFRRDFLANNVEFRKPNPPLGNRNVVARVENLLQNVFQIHESQYFIKAEFTTSYFPDFDVIIPNFVDLRSIMNRAKVGSYKNIYEIVHDLRQIVYSGNMYLKQNPNFLLEISTTTLERELNKLLSDDFFSYWDFTKISGHPSDVIPDVTGLEYKVEK